MPRARAASVGVWSSKPPCRSRLGDTTRRRTDRFALRSVTLRGMDVELRPRLRGVFHQYAFFASLVAVAILVVLADSGRELVATWVYGASLAAMFGVSALYHRVNWRSLRVRAWMRRLDHSTILLLIAGTYTPFALLAFDGVVAEVVLLVVWIG